LITNNYAAEVETKQTDMYLKMCRWLWLHG